MPGIIAWESREGRMQESQVFKSSSTQCIGEASLGYWRLQLKGKIKGGRKEGKRGGREEGGKLFHSEKIGTHENNLFLLSYSTSPKTFTPTD